MPNPKERVPNGGILGFVTSLAMWITGYCTAPVWVPKEWEWEGNSDIFLLKILFLNCSIYDLSLSTVKKIE